MTDALLLKTVQAAELLGITPRSFYNLRPSLVAFCGLEEYHLPG